MIYDPYSVIMITESTTNGLAQRLDLIQYLELRVLFVMCYIVHVHVKELYPSSVHVSDTHVCSTHSLMHCVLRLLDSL